MTTPSCQQKTDHGETFFFFHFFSGCTVSGYFFLFIFKHTPNNSCHSWRLFLYPVQNTAKLAKKMWAEQGIRKARPCAMFFVGFFNIASMFALFFGNQPYLQIKNKLSKTGPHLQTKTKLLKTGPTGRPRSHLAFCFHHQPRSTGNHWPPQVSWTITEHHQPRCPGQPPA